MPALRAAASAVSSWVPSVSDSPSPILWVKNVIPSARARVRIAVDKGPS
jgi:hypothetical protein